MKLYAYMATGKPVIVSDLGELTDVPALRQQQAAYFIPPDDPDALAAAIIASDTASNQEWIRHGQNGWQVDLIDLSGFTTASLQALREPLNPEAIQANRKRVETEAYFETNMQAVEAAFIQMASKTAQSRIASATKIDAV